MTGEVFFLGVVSGELSAGISKFGSLWFLVYCCISSDLIVSRSGRKGAAAQRGYIIYVLGSLLFLVFRLYCIPSDLRFIWFLSFGSSFSDFAPNVRSSGFEFIWFLSFVSWCFAGLSRQPFTPSPFTPKYAYL